MLICSKMKKTFVTTALAIAMIPSVASACNPVNPICLFQKMMKATPGLPVLDFVSIPAMIPNTPAALLKEAQNKAKEIVDKKFQKAHAEEKTDDVKMDKVPSLSAMEMAPNQEFSSLESFPKMDSEDPLEIAKAIEVLFLRPGWQDKKALSSLSAYDEALMMYYRDAFQLNNIVELVGTYAILDAKIEEISARQLRSRFAGLSVVDYSKRTGGYRIAGVFNFSSGCDEAHFGRTRFDQSSRSKC